MLKHAANTKEYELKHISLSTEAQPAKASEISDLIYTGAVYLQFLGWIFGCLVEISQATLNLFKKHFRVVNVTFY